MVSTSIILMAQPRRCQSALETNFLLTCFSTSTTCLARSCCNGKTPTVGSIARTGDRTLLVPALMEPAAVATWGHCRKPAHGCGLKCQLALWAWKEARSTEWHLLWTRAAPRGTSRAKLRLMQRRRRHRLRVILFGSKMACRRERLPPRLMTNGTGSLTRFTPASWLTNPKSA